MAFHGVDNRPGLLSLVWGLPPQHLSDNDKVEVKKRDRCM